jgi:hypothetical protein
MEHRPLDTPKEKGKEISDDVFGRGGEKQEKDVRGADT